MRNLLYWDFRNLEDSEASLEEVVKSGAGSLRTEFATEELEKKSQAWKKLTRKRWHLHAEEGEDEDEENEEDEQGDDGGDGVHEGLDQAAHGFPVPVRGQQR